ncbi:MAG: hypothetical protein GC181_10070 [Bacteroidetes bacterium]|nr:hypothetical protein [Bacteroidota bacterium]
MNHETSQNFYAVFSVLFYQTESVKATHVMGADVTYTCDSAKAYTFRITFYRSCQGVPFANPSSETKVKCASGGASIGVSLNLISITDVTPYCDSEKSHCNPKNTYSTGEGVEAHIYEGHIDFNKSPYSILLTNGCQMIFETGQCCRNSDITTGAANQYFYTYAMLDICKAPVNNSPQYLHSPIAFQCCNQPVYTSMGAYDYYDYDSISYELAKPLKALNSPISYSGSYSYTQPFKVYDPTGKGVVNPNAVPPQGLYVNSQTGEITFTPVKCDEKTIAVFEVKEWRKDTSGQYNLIGMVRRDMQFETKNCVGNNTPLLASPYSYKIKATACEKSGKFCFNVKTTDKIKLPPPNQDTLLYDTVRFLNTVLPDGVTFYAPTTNEKNPVGTVCLDLSQIDVNKFVNEPLRIEVSAKDNACPLTAVSTRVYLITFDTTTQVGKITGRILDDPNDNCAYDAGEGKHNFIRAIGHYNFKGSKLTYIETDKNGIFEMCSDTGWHIYKLMSNLWTVTNCDTFQINIRKDSVYDRTLFSRLKYGIAGYVYSDEGSCNVKSGSIPIKNQKLIATPGDHIVTTDEQGFYLFDVPPGSYKIRLLSDSVNFITRCADTQSVSLSSSTTVMLDTFLTYQIPRSDIQVEITCNSGKVVRKGDDVNLVVTVRNIGTYTADTAIVTLQVPSGFVDSSKSSSIWKKVAWDKYQMTLLNLVPGYKKIATMHIKSGTMYLGDTLLSLVFTDSSVLKKDADWTNNSDSITFKIVKPYDPNLKTAEPDSVFTVDDRKLNYTIRFQNEGTGNAVNVMLLDTLPKNLDPATLELHSASSYFTYQLQENILLINFQDINLPPKSQDTAGSVGSIQFSISLRDTIYHEEFVKNRVGIYFDFEEVVMTNTQINHFKSPVEFTDTTKRFFCANDSLHLPFYSTLIPSITNYFILEATDSSGDLNTFKAIDTLYSKAQTDIFNLPVPDALIPGKHYTFRIRTSDFPSQMFTEKYLKNIEISRAPDSKLIYADSKICSGSEFQIQPSQIHPSNKLFINGNLIKDISSGVYNSDTVKNNDIFWFRQTSSHGCTENTDSVSISVFAQPEINFDIDSVICKNTTFPGFKINLNTTAGIGQIDSLFWNFGDGQHSETANGDPIPVHVYSNGDFVASVVARNDMCLDTAYSPIHSGVSPQTSIIGMRTEICESDSLEIPGSVTFKIGSLSKSVLKTGDANSYSDYSIKHQYADSGTYNITLIAEDNFGCSDTSTASVRVIKGPVADIETDKTFGCSNHPELYLKTNIQNDYKSLVWTLDSKNYTQTNFTHTFSGTGTFPIELIVLAEGGCNDTVETTYTIYDIEKASFSVPTQICLNEELSINCPVLDPITIYHWDVAGSSYTGHTIKPDVSSLVPGNYIVTLWTETGTHCFDTVSQPFEMKDAPVSEFSIDSACSGIPVTLINATTNAKSNTQYSVNWADGNSTSFNTNLITDQHIYYTAGTYQVSLIARTDACSDTMEHSTTVFEFPSADFTMQLIDGALGKYQFTNLSGNQMNSFWSFENESPVMNNNQFVDHNFSEPGEFSVMLIAQGFGDCSDTTIKSLDYITNITFYIPNSFSNNGDGRNDKFNIVPEKYVKAVNFNVYNRWGGHMLKSEDAGNLINEDLPYGIYAYTLEVVDIYGKHHYFSGTLYNLIGE